MLGLPGITPTRDGAHRGMGEKPMADGSLTFLPTYGMKHEKARDRLIVALDVGDVDEAEQIVRELEGTVDYFKIGLHLQLDPNLHRLFAYLLRREKKVFLDFKAFDIPATVAGAVRASAALGVTFITVIGQGQIVEAAVKARGNSELKILVVTLLTGMNEKDMQREYSTTIPMDEFVIKRARFAADQGCDGVISSAREVALIRKNVARKDFLIVTPGIRPRDASVVNDDQKRVMTPYDAIIAGANYLVVGRPIVQQSDRARAAERILGEMQRALAALTDTDMRELA
jgi:orotidine-5'-phosphate decarboxylase